jgi:hypothetical protein
MFNLITTYYNSNNEIRQKEINNCLINNFNNQYIKQIYLLNDSIYDLNFINDCDNKIIQIVVDDNNKKRLGFDYAFSFINKNLIGEKCIVSNSDIYFDDTLELLKEYNFNKKCLALTRYDGDKLVFKSNSQDSWFFESPIDIDVNKFNFKFGHPGCDNRIAQIVHESGYTIINPCLTIKTHHLHQSGIRNWTAKDRIDGKYLYLNFCKL